MRSRFLALLLAWMLLWPVLAGAVDLSPGQGLADLQERMRYAAVAPGAGDTLAVMVERFRAGDFGPDLSVTTLATNFAPEVWGAVTLTNATLDDGRPPDAYVLTVDLALVSELEVWLIRQDGLTEGLLDYSLFEPFAPAQHSVTRLRAPEFRLAPGETVTLMAQIGRAHV